MPAATKTRKPSEHDTAIESLANLEARQAAELAEAEGEAAAAQAAFDKWRMPELRHKAAQQRLGHLSWSLPRALTEAEAAVVASADPSLQKEISRLEHELLAVGNLFRSWAEPATEFPFKPTVGSNAVACNTYRESCLSAIAALKRFQHQLHDEASARDKIRELRAASAPRPDASMM